MRIAVLIPGWDWWGSTLVAASHAAIFAKMGHQVSLFALGDGNLLGMDLGMKVNILKHLPGLPPWERPWRPLFNVLPPPLHLPFIYGSIRALSDFEVVIAYDEPTSQVAYYAKRLYGLKYVYFAEGSRLIKSKEAIYEKVYFRFVDRWMRKFCREAGLVITESATGREILKQRYGVESAVTGGMIDLSLFLPAVNGRKVRDFYRLGDSPLILYVDCLAAYKGVEILINAFNLVIESIPNARLMLIGKPRPKSYQERVQRQCNQSVIFLDYIPHNELPAFYAASTLFATGTLWEEGFSHTIVEAQACAKPVVAFKIGPHEEVVKNRETGILVDRVGDAQALASAMLSLLTDHGLANAMGQKAAAWASHLTSNAIGNLQRLMDKIASL